MRYSIRDKDLLFQDLKLYLKAIGVDLTEYIKYNILGEPFPSRILPPDIDIQWMYSKKTKSFIAKASNFPDIFTTSNSIDGIIDNVNDAIYEFYDIPRYVVKKITSEKGNFYSPPPEALEKLRKDGYKQLDKVVKVKFNKNAHVPSFA